MPVLERARFSGHETFPFRYTWLKKAVDHVRREPSIFGREDAMVTFGVGKNMVQSMRHWGQVCGAIEEDPDVPNNRGRSLRVTRLGKLLFEEAGWDPYLEDPATLWILHWQVAHTPDRATTWYWVFNELSSFEFDRDGLVAELMRLGEQHGWLRIAENSIRRDVDCFIRSYAVQRPTKRALLEDTLDCPLVELGLIAGATNSFSLPRGDHVSLPDEVFAYALLEFIGARGTRAMTVSLEEILFAPGSPGRVFCLTENAAMRRLDSLHALTKGKFSYDETAGLKQVLAFDAFDALSVLRTYYRRNSRSGNEA